MRALFQYVQHAIKPLQKRLAPLLKPINTNTSLFGLDVRALAAMRLMLGLVLIADVLIRASDMVLFYTDAGLHSRALAINHLGPLSNPEGWSVFFVSGSPLWAGLLFALMLMCALAFFAGWRTRLATVLCWILWVSLSNRNLSVLSAGDVLLRLSLFWSMFLPLGAWWSLDRATNRAAHPELLALDEVESTDLPALKSSQPLTVANMATAALIAQVVMLYVFTAYLKISPEWQETGQALFYALQLDYYTRPLGAQWLAFPVLLQWSSWATWWVEALAPLAMLMPVYNAAFRTIAVLVLVHLHLGIDALMYVGLFPWVDMAVLIALLPTPAWDWLDRFCFGPICDDPSPRAWRRNIQVFYDGDCRVCRKLVYVIKTFFWAPQVRLAPAQSDAVAHQTMQAQNSWVLRTPDGTQYTGFDAVLVGMQAAPLLALWVPMLRLAPLKQWGDGVYRWVADHRPAVAKPLGWLTWHTTVLITTLRKSTSVLLLLAVFLCLWWNLRVSIPKDKQPPVLAMPIAVERAINVLSLAQYWSMFAPYPLNTDGWLVIPGHLRDGTPVNVLDPNQPVQWHNPGTYDRLYKNDRWHKFFERLVWGPHAEDHRLALGQYFCRRWNRDAKLPEGKALNSIGGKALNTFSIIWMEEHATPTISGHPPAKPRQLWRHGCFGAP